MKTSLRQQIEEYIRQYKTLITQKENIISNCVSMRNYIDANNERVKIDLLKLIISDLETSLK